MTTPGPPKPPASVEETLAQFQDFDLVEVFKQAQPHAQSSESKNFVVEFGPKRARIAFDLDGRHFKTLLSIKRHDDYPIRWINIWDPLEEYLDVLGKHYSFSERLIRIMSMQVEKPHARAAAAARRARDKALASGRPRQRQPDVESGAPVNGSIPLESFPAQQDITQFDDDNLELYLQVKDTVNYFSTDQTQKALCIGAHWLHKRPKREHEPKRDHHEVVNKSMMPPKHWQWLTLCNDHTVLSIHEKPASESTSDKDDEKRYEHEELCNIRANTLDVLLQLSTHGFKLYMRKPLSLNSVRRPLSDWLNTTDRATLSRHETGMSFANRDEPVSLADEGTSNLFYYLFEDYVAAGPLKTAERKLEQMTNKVLNSARPKIRNKSTDIIPTLHHLSRDLRELKHLFEIYKNLISKLTVMGAVEIQGAASPECNRKVMLTGSALSRFERLGDRLQFLMLNTIDGYLEEINALSSTYFNLTQQKDSEATARLTRSATLLAKLSVFFLPISFLTSYFSIQVEDLYKYWHAADYWYSFAVIASASFVLLFFFSRLLMFASDTLDEWNTYISAWFARRFGFNIDEDE